MSDHQKKSDSRGSDQIIQGQYLTPFQHTLLQNSLQTDLPLQHRNRIQIMLLYSQGKSQTEICRIVSCSQATARYWISIARNGLAHNWTDRPIVGRPRTVSDQYLERLKQLVSQSPKKYHYSFQRWTAYWLAHQLEKEFGIKITPQHINRLLKGLGLSTRPQAKSDPIHNSTASGFVIGDLTGTSAPEALEMLTFNSIY